MPTPSVPPSSPPKRDTFYSRLEGSSDGLWYLIGEYGSENSARTKKSKLAMKTKPLPPGKWEFRHGQIPGSDKWGLWARNLEGSLAGTDEQ